MLVALVFIVRSVGYSHSVVVDWDESMYLLMARELLHGGLPYVTIFQEKPLGPTVFVAAALWIFGESIWSLRLLGSLCVAATTLLLLQLALAGGLSRLAAVGGAMLYAIYSARMGGMASNTEILFTPFTVGAVLIAVRAKRAADGKAQYRAIGAIGLLIGIGVWFKYIVAFTGCAIFGLLVGNWFRLGRCPANRVLALAAVYFVVCMLPTGVTGIYYAAIGQWDPFWYCNFGFMPIYASLTRPGAEIFLAFHDFFWFMFEPVFLALLGVWFWRDRRIFVLAIVSWLMAEAVALSVPWKFYDHYFLLILPPICILAAGGIDGIIRRGLHPRRIAWLSRMPPAILVVIALVLVWKNLSSAQARFDRPDPSRQIADFLDRDPDATVWVVNHEPIIYFLANKSAPTVYAFPLHLVGAFSILIRTDPEVEIRRVLATRPRYVVLDPVDRNQILPRYDAIISATLAADYELAFSARGRVDNISVYRLRYRGA